MVQEVKQISPQLAQILAHKIRWKIMKMLVNEEMLYAKRIAAELGLSESKVHYHMNKLRTAGLISQTGTQMIKKGRAILFKPVANQFLLSLLDNDAYFSKTAFNIIFKNFIHNGNFRGKIITGSAQPHGRYDAISRDGYLVGELCWYLASHIRFQNKNFIPNMVLTDLEYEKLNPRKNDSLILIGGHITNTLTAYYNETLLKSKFGIYFSENLLTNGTITFSNPEHALIALFRNPSNKSEWVLTLSGVRSLGTKAAIYAIISDYCEVFNDDSEFVTIIKGESSDGTHIDGVVEVLRKSPII